MSFLNKNKPSWDFELMGETVYEELDSINILPEDLEKIQKKQNVKNKIQELINQGIDVASDYDINFDDGKIKILKKESIEVAPVPTKQIIPGVQNNKLYLYAGGALLAYMIWRR